MAKRTIIEKWLRLADIREKYKEQIIGLADKQFEIEAKVIKEFGLQDSYEYRDIIHYVDGKYHHLRVESDGMVAVWENSFRSDPASHCQSYNVSEMIVLGKFAEYEQRYRTCLKPAHERMVESKQHEKEKRKESLEAELARLNQEINRLG